jgi:uncharacterized membrane protein HdeD (DUF308 family)
MEQQRYGWSHGFHDVAEIRKNWGGFLALGLLLIILGSLGIVYSIFTTFFSVFLLGALLVASGIIEIIQSFWARHWSGVFFSILLGILYLVTGGLCFARPVASAVALTLLIAAFCFIGGLFKMINALILRFSHWGWVFFNGLVTFILGMLIVADWPVSGLWVIGLFVGIDILLLGWTWVVLALAARKSYN